MKNWRLVMDLVAYFPYGKENIVYLSAADKKSMEIAVIKQIEGSFDSLSIDQNEFEVKLGKGGKEDLSLYVRSQKFPKVDSWYLVENFCNNYYDMISQLSCDSGFFKGYTFLAVFCDKEPAEVNFCCKEMKEYYECYEEMKRRLNCEFFKKTRKWIPGHRYDSLTETYHYLGPVKSRRLNDKSSEFIEDQDKCSEVYLIVSGSLKEDEKSISDVFRNRVIGVDIQVLSSIPLMVDSGETLVNDYIDYSDYVDTLLDNTVKKCKVTQKFGYISYENPKLIFDVFSYLDKKTPDLSTTKDRVEEIVKDLIFDCILHNWNLDYYRQDLTIGTKKSVEDNIKSLKDLFLTRGIMDSNALRNIYYTGLFKNLGIDLEGLITNAITSWDETDVVYGSFDNYMKYLFYTKEHNGNATYISQQRDKSASVHLEISTLKDLFGESDLRDLLVEIVGYAKENMGYGLDEYEVFNVGSKKSPIEYVSCKVSVQNLIDYLKYRKGELEVPETLKNEIISRKFSQLSISFDKNCDTIK